jgi:putative MFS transporter
MSRNSSLFSSARHAAAFWIGSAAVTGGTLLHLPMFWMGRATGFKLAGMPMDMGMTIGMALIVAGIGAAAYGLRPQRPSRHVAASITQPPDAPLTRAHWTQMGILAVALVIDVMKAGSLGFVVPGMRAEYGIDRSTAAMLPLVALLGTTVGSFVWGALADVYGRRASILLAAVMFVGTSICGAMPSFWWNVFMCFIMGMAAGGMLPVANALLAEIMPPKHRGWCLVLIGGIGTVGGYFVASASSALLQPFFGWRVMWLLGLPTGLVLIALSPFMPESARFLLQMGRIEEARETFARFGTVITADAATTPAGAIPARAPDERVIGGTTVALTLAALVWGLVNYGVLLWLPAALVAEGRSVALASAIIARSTLVAVPAILVATYLYSAWSTKWALVTAIGITALGLVATLLRGNDALAMVSNPVVSVSLLIVGTSWVISFLLPYTTESFPIRLRGRATGWVAGSSKAGGVIAQGLASLALVPALGVAAGAIAVPAVLSLVLVAIFGRETRGRDLRELEGAKPAQRA